VQELLGHSDVTTTMVYTHVLNRGGLGVMSPIDRLSSAMAAVPSQPSTGAAGAIGHGTAAATAVCGRRPVAPVGMAASDRSYRGFSKPSAVPDPGDHRGNILPLKEYAATLLSARAADGCEAVGAVYSIVSRPLNSQLPGSN